MFRISEKSIAVVLLIISSVVFLIEGLQENDFYVGRQKVKHSPTNLSPEDFHKYAILSDESHLSDAINRILIPRVVGTENHKKVREYIIESLKHLNWDVNLHAFHDHTPIFGKLHFHNIIATLNPNAERYLILACHYDSKYFKDMEFHGATDSAVPCAMLLNVAHVLRKELDQFRNTKLSLMLVFFDGEEAFEKWGPKDSIYGARHLAQHWEEQNLLDRIDMLVLLDLIGAPDPSFYSFHNNTESWYSRLIDVEDRLGSSGFLQRYMANSVYQFEMNRYFQPNTLISSLIEDDHLPFLERNVPILHLIPIPFPSIWHTEDDNVDCIDYTTTENIARIVRLFTMEYLLPSEEEQH